MPKRKRASRKTIGTKFSDSTTFSDSTSSSSASSSSSKMRKKGTGGIKETSNGRFTATYKKKNVGTFSSYDLADKEMAYYIKTGVLKKRKVIITKRGTRSNNKTGYTRHQVEDTNQRSKSMTKLNILVPTKHVNKLQKHTTKKPLKNVDHCLN